MFCPRYQLTHDPFSKSLAAKDVYATKDFIACCSRLDYLERNRGLALITASAGYGKTLCMRAFAEKQNTSLVKVVYLCMSTLTTSEFYRQLSQALGLEPLYRKADMFRELQSHLETLSVQRKIHCIIILDEAQYLNPDILRDLKMLMNFDYDSRDRFSLVLTGQPTLADMLSRQIHESLKQRITVSYEFAGIGEGEAKEYADKMITLAGGSTTIFDDAAIHAAFNCSNGAIRVLGHVLSRALVIGEQNDANQIGSDIIMAAANELEIR
jgi:type II secretory pathway predicted ATPase ExeA